MIDIKQSSRIEKIPVKVNSSAEFSRKLYRMQIREHRAEIRRCKLRSRIVKLNSKLVAYGN